MKAEATAVMTIGSPSIAVPDDFIDVRDLRITGPYATRLLKGDERSVQDHYEYDGAGGRINGQPRRFFLSGGGFLFDTAPDRAYPLLNSYYARPAPLSASVPTNFLTTDAPRLLRSASMLIAVEFEKEVGQGQYDRTYWQLQTDKLMSEFQAASDVADFAYGAAPEFG